MWGLVFSSTRLKPQLQHKSTPRGLSVVSSFLIFFFAWVLSLRCKGGRRLSGWLSLHDELSLDSAHALVSSPCDSEISDLSLSRSVAVTQTQMSSPSLVYVWLGQWASTSESYKPTHTRTKSYTCNVSWTYWEYHRFAGSHLDCRQTACEMCRSLSGSMDSFRDTSPQEAAFASGSSAVRTWQLVESLRELQKEKKHALISSYVFSW